MSAVTSSTRVANAPVAVKPAESSPKESFSTKAHNAFCSTLPVLTGIVNIASASSAVVNGRAGEVLLGVAAGTILLNMGSSLPRVVSCSRVELKDSFVRSSIYSATGAGLAYASSNSPLDKTLLGTANSFFSFGLGYRAVFSTYDLATRILTGTSEIKKQNDADDKKLEDVCSKLLDSISKK